MGVRAFVQAMPLVFCVLFVTIALVLVLAVAVRERISTN